MKKESTCKTCGKPVLWVTMETGAKMMVDKDSIKNGVVLNGTFTKGAIRSIGNSHFMTCPQASQHRRKK